MTTINFTQNIDFKSFVYLSKYRKYSLIESQSPLNRGLLVKTSIDSLHMWWFIFHHPFCLRLFHSEYKNEHIFCNVKHELKE